MSSAAPTTLPSLASESILQRLARLPLPGYPALTWLDLADQVAIEHGVTTASIATSRMKSPAAARHHLWGALRGAGYSLPEIARPFGVDHTTVLNGIRRARR